jgi:2-amino-4-hydroxy-6-hydroxymethyldihydropteridine diphosphokinase
MLYYLSLGSNLGDRESTLRSALQLIEQRIGSVLRCSSFYYSKPWGFTSQNDFCNLCCALETDKKPLDVLRLTQTIERALGRNHKSQEGHYSDRSIDIDLIRVFDNDKKELFMDSPELTLPHRFWQERDFVKTPLAEIMPR